MTELAFISSAAQKDAFKDLDVEQYEIVATLDSHTSEICQEMNGKHFDMKDYEPGVTAPPFHVYCRSTTVPYFDDEWGRSGERAARDEEGNTYYVPSDMTYSEWKESFIDGDISNLRSTKLIENTQPELQDEGIRILENLTYDERKALNDYMSAESYVINDKLRRGVHLSSDEETMIRNLDSALKKYPKYEGDLQRSLYFHSEDDIINFIKEYRVGNEITYKEFISTTKGECYNPDGQVQIFFVNAKNGIDISEVNAGEQGVLYGRKSSFKVIKMIEKDEKYYVVMEEID